MNNRHNNQYRRVALIVNPASGTVSKLKIVPHVVEKLARLGIDIDTYNTSHAGHATELARHAALAGKYDAVLVCGGDGTVNEAACGLLGTDMPMAIVPAGSGNGLARHLGMPVDIDRSLNIFAHGNIIDADCGTANGSNFFCTFGVGFDAAVSERFARSRRRGLTTYLISALDEYVRFCPDEYVIEANGRTIAEKAFLVVVCNASQYGNNAFIAPNASITDGKLDVTIVHTGNLVQQALLGMDFITGYIGRNALIDTFRTSSLRIHRKDGGPAHIDGDPVEMPSDISIECRPAALKIFAPTKETSFKPIITPMSLFFRDMFLHCRHLIKGH